MKAKRYNCEECNNFIPPIPKEPDNLISDIEKAKCTSGMRLNFRHPKSPMDDNYGWFRYCNEFIEKK